MSSPDLKSSSFYFRDTAYDAEQRKIYEQAGDKMSLMRCY